MADPSIEYVLVPGFYSRFGNTIYVNSVHMRSCEAVTSLPSSDERRVMICGDSIVNGGSLTDQAALATELLPMLARNTGFCKKLTVCNISAGSWGPSNLLAYVRRFGTFGCKDAVIVLNTGDACDVTTFRELGLEHPTSRPRLALLDLLQNYGGRLLRINSTQIEEELESSATDFSELLEFLIQNGVHCSVVLHLSKQELLDGLHYDVQVLKIIAAMHGVPWSSTKQRFLQSLDNGINPYQDDLHPNEAGQLALGRAILDSLISNSVSPGTNITHQ
jgi:hypothetical protein